MSMFYIDMIELYFFENKGFIKLKSFKREMFHDLKIDFQLNICF